ncbi:MAG TPA: hypothetical protein VMF10_14745, partial [Candidatus Aquilonibacter sp.]|nr:hypothetical protein [Candidatus Aquilonibacter sp.]
MTTVTAQNLTATENKKDEKTEKRRALGRGLESLLPGPRVVTANVPISPTLNPAVPPAEIARIATAPGETESPGPQAVPL